MLMCAACCCSTQECYFWQTGLACLGWLHRATELHPQLLPQMTHPRWARFFRQSQTESAQRLVLCVAAAGRAGSRAG